LTLGDIEADLVSFSEGLESFPLNRGEMDENVRAIFLLDKSETLGIIKPFHFSLCHSLCSFVLRGRLFRAAALLRLKNRNEHQLVRRIDKFSDALFTLLQFKMGSNFWI